MFFFFQAEDGIRDIGVTGVQTCALPIFDGGTAGDGGAGGGGLVREPGLELLLGPAHQVADRAEGAGIGRASCRERGENSVVAASLKKNTLTSNKLVRSQSHHT